MKFTIRNGYLDITAETPEEGVAIGATWDRLCRSGCPASINQGVTLTVKFVTEGMAKEGNKP